MHQKRTLWGADIAFVFLIRPDGKSSCIGGTYLQYHNIMESHGWVPLPTQQVGENHMDKQKKDMDLVAPSRKVKGLTRCAESIILLVPPLMVGNVASEILLRCKIELMFILVNNLLLAKCHLSWILWAVRLPSWHGVQDCFKGHQSWPPNSVEHLLLRCWVKPRNGTNLVLCCHLPWARIVMSFVKPWAWGVGDMHLPQQEQGTACKLRWCGRLYWSFFCLVSSPDHYQEVPFSLGKLLPGRLVSSAKGRAGSVRDAEVATNQTLLSHREGNWGWLLTLPPWMDMGMSSLSFPSLFGAIGHMEWLGPWLKTRSCSWRSWFGQVLMPSYLEFHADCSPGDSSYQQALYFLRPFPIVYVDGSWSPSCWSNCLCIVQKIQPIRGSTASGVIHILDAVSQGHCQSFAVANHLHSVPVCLLQVL